MDKNDLQRIAINSKKIAAILEKISEALETNERISGELADRKRTYEKTVALWAEDRRLLAKARKTADKLTEQNKKLAEQVEREVALRHKLNRDHADRVTTFKTKIEADRLHHDAVVESLKEDIVWRDRSYEGLRTRTNTERVEREVRVQKLEAELAFVRFDAGEGSGRGRCRVTDNEWKKRKALKAWKSKVLDDACAQYAAWLSQPINPHHRLYRDDRPVK